MRRDEHRATKQETNSCLEIERKEARGGALTGGVVVHRHRLVHAVPHLLAALPPANLPATHRPIGPPRCRQLPGAGTVQPPPRTRLQELGRGQRQKLRHQ